MVCALIVELVSVDKRMVLPFNVEKTIPPNCMLDAVITLLDTVLPLNVDTAVVETDRVETVRVERVAVLP
jgi:hypothetical protein